MKKLTAVLLGAALTLTACEKAEVKKMLDPNYDFRGLPHADKEPEVKINPARKNRYEVTVNFKDAPGGFAFAEGTELYYARNCKYTTNRMMGATSNPSFNKTTLLKKVGDTVYEGVFYTDSPLDEDYYGQGVCQWKHSITSVYLRASTTDKGDTNFSLDIDSEIFENLSSQGSLKKMTFYFEKNSYPRMGLSSIDGSGYIVTGVTKEQIKQRDLNLNEFFPIEVEVRRI